MSEFIQYRPTPEEAEHFCIILQAGVPAAEAILYFLTPEERSNPQFVKDELGRWLGSSRVGAAQKRLMNGKGWQDMTLEERVKWALDKHYAEIAYYLYSHNYSEATGFDKTKADTCRQVLEAKVAGTAGKSSLDLFLDDFKAGKFKAKPLPLPPPKGQES